MNTSIFKAYDIRGVYPKDINAETVTTIGKAVATMFSDGQLVLGYDARHGSTELVKILAEAISEEAAKLNKNISLVNIGLCTTPMFYFTVCDMKAVGGCMITASHNPKEYNGIKMVRDMGKMIPGTEVLEVINSLKS